MELAQCVDHATCWYFSEHIDTTRRHTDGLSPRAIFVREMRERGRTEGVEGSQLVSSPAACQWRVWLGTSRLLWAEFDLRREEQLSGEFESAGGPVEGARSKGERW